MTINKFSSRFTIVLNERERFDLAEVYHLEPHLLDEVQLIHRAIRAGTRALAQMAKEKKNPLQLTRSEIEARTHVRARQADSSGMASCGEVATPHRHVETYLGVFVGEGLRQRLEDFLGAHEDLDEETAYALLLDLGLTKAEEEPESVDPAKVQGHLESELTRSTSTPRQRRLRRLEQIRALARGY